MEEFHGVVDGERSASICSIAWLRFYFFVIVDGGDGIMPGGEESLEDGGGES